MRAAALLRAGLCLALVFCLLAYAAGLLASFAVDEQRMEAKFDRYADDGLSGLDAGQHVALARAITGFLKGDLMSAQVRVSRRGESGPAFSEKELAHLSDIRGLVALAGRLRVAALILLASGLALFFTLRRLRPALLRAVRPQRALAGTLLAVFALTAAAALWAALDFDSLFILFHRLLFSNDLWLLNPRSDLLLQLMPGAFFVSYAGDLLTQAWPVLLALPLAAWALTGAGRAAS